MAMRQEKEGAVPPVKNISQERHLMVQPLEMGGTGIYHKIELELHLVSTISEMVSVFCHFTHWRKRNVQSTQCNVSASKPLPKRSF